MATDRLSWWWKINELGTHPVENSPGVYLLYLIIGGHCRYVGRSDTNLRRRLMNRPYRWYRYKHCVDDIESYEWECRYYHQHFNTIDNKIHPDSPPYANCRCPISDCPHS